jgi:copper resistance protein C
MDRAIGWKGRTLLIWFVALLGFGLAIAGAAAHSRLTKSDPAARAVLDAAPKELKLWFNEKVEPAFAKVWIGKEEGSCIEQKTCVALTSRGDASDPKLLIVTLPNTLPPGSVDIGYHVLSVDGHTIEGKLSFGVKSK